MSGQFLRGIAVRETVRAEQSIRKIAIEIFRGVVLKSPVDTGRFRGAWGANLGGIPAETLDRLDKTGEATIVEAVAKIRAMNIDRPIYIFNLLPYARRLEYGYSKQAPAGMVRTTLAEISAHYGV